MDIYAFSNLLPYTQLEKTCLLTFVFQLRLSLHRLYTRVEMLAHKLLAFSTLIGFDKLLSKVFASYWFTHQHCKKTHVSLSLYQDLGLLNFFFPCVKGSFSKLVLFMYWCAWAAEVWWLASFLTVGGSSFTLATSFSSFPYSLASSFFLVYRTLQIHAAMPLLIQTIARLFSVCVTCLWNLYTVSQPCGLLII